MFDEFISFVRTKKRGMVRYSAYGTLRYGSVHYGLHIYLYKTSKREKYDTVQFGTVR